MRKIAIPILCLIALAVVGCKSYTYNLTDKTVTFSPRAFAFERPAATVAEVTDQVTDSPGEEMILPDGSYFTTSGGGSAGNVWIIVTQNDGTEQDSKATADVSTEADIDANVNSLDEETGGAVGVLGGLTGPDEPAP